MPKISDNYKDGPVKSFDTKSAGFDDVSRSTISFQDSLLRPVSEFARSWFIITDTQDGSALYDSRIETTPFSTAVPNITEHHVLSGLN